MDNLKIGFNFLKHFLKPNHTQTTQGLMYTQKFDQQIKYNYMTRFKFWLFLYSTLILTRTPKHHAWFPEINLTNVKLQNKAFPESELLYV